MNNAYGNWPNLPDLPSLTPVPLTHSVSAPTRSFRSSSIVKHDDVDCDDNNVDIIDNEKLNIVQEDETKGESKAESKAVALAVDTDTASTDVALAVHNGDSKKSARGVNMRVNGAQPSPNKTRLRTKHMVPLRTKQDAWLTGDDDTQLRPSTRAVIAAMLKEWPDTAGMTSNVIVPVTSPTTTATTTTSVFDHHRYQHQHRHHQYQQYPHTRQDYQVTDPIPNYGTNPYYYYPTHHAIDIKPKSVDDWILPADGQVTSPTNIMPSLEPFTNVVVVAEETTRSQSTRRQQQLMSYKNNAARSFRGA